MDYPDRYYHDVDIISIIYNFDSLTSGEPEILAEPQLIFFCRCGCASKQIGENTYETTQYEYFKYIFIKPSRYDIHLRTEKVSWTTEEMLYPAKTYGWNPPFTCDLKLRETTPVHSHWEITFGGNPLDPDYDPAQLSYISIYADSLRIEPIAAPGGKDS